MANASVPARRDELTAGYLDELRNIEEETEATAFSLECRAREAERARAHEEARRKQRVDDLTTEALQTVVSVGAGGLSTVTVGGFALGAAANFVMGTAAKVGCLVEPESRALRVACQSGKTLLHSQLSIWTRKLISGG